MSINATSEEGEGEDDFGDAIHIVHNERPPKKRREKKEKEEEESQPDKGKEGK